MAHYINDKCTRCAACLNECPTSSILEAEPIFLIDADTCTDCRVCVQLCPYEAIKKIQIGSQ